MPVGLLAFMLKLCHMFLCSLKIGRYGFNLYILFYLCEPVGLLPFMLKLCYMNLCGFMHIKLCSSYMGMYGFKLYILFY